jgi:hypothetical protein
MSAAFLLESIADVTASVALPSAFCIVKKGVLNISAVVVVKSGVRQIQMNEVACKINGRRQNGQSTDINF